MENEKALVLVSGGELMESDVISNAITFAQQGFGGKPITLPKGYDLSRAVKNFCFALPTVTNIETATKESIYQAVHEYITKGYDIGKHQCALIVYKDKDNKGNYTGTGQLTVQPEYFGQIARVKRERPDIKEISEGTVIYAGEKVALSIDSKGNQHIKHEQDFGCWNNEIAGAYAIVTYENGDTHAEIMPMTEIKQAWAQSRNGDKVHKAFPSEMARKTVLNRLCKKLLNKSDDSAIIGDIDERQSFEDEIIDIDDVESYTEPGEPEIEELQETESMSEPKEVTAQQEDAPPQEQGDPESEDYCITIPYSDYKNKDKDKYRDCETGRYDKPTKTIVIYPNRKKTDKKAADQCN